MRIVIMLNPTNKRGTKTAYTKLRKFLISDGYIMLQPEVFVRVVTNRKSAEKHLNRIEEYNPKSGTIRAFTMTEKQYSKIHFITGGADYQEEMVGNSCNVML